MTISGDFVPSDGRDFGSEPAYPTIFGIALTPTISGVLVAVLGIGASAYLLLNQVQPAWNTYQTLQAEAEQKETQIQQRGNIQKKIDTANKNLEQAKQRRTEVYALFADERTLDTLLLDLNRLVNARKAKLSSFTPAPEPATVVSDGSLGPAVNGKLKRKEITVNLEGNYEQTQSIMRSVERLQPLLLVKSFNSQLDQSTQKITVDRRGRLLPVGRPETNLKTSFKLQALLPLSSEEAAAAAKPPAQ
ncbi:pilus assembly protein [Trichocoleus sp. FACHB-591]|uniref:pilus assembly protein n=1 Tax=Trichocoleus TaxID=450526 RepID=UPI001682BF7B|nr:MULTISPECIES: pilus assembly protein [unclassified Trichocoleus]MBD2094204.1 pilus assembly protein [Trichocoleus sp. FACHB-591]MBD2122393.1 pilus assembly protein [Trichocoleus sp. FACHB-262]